MKIKLYLFVFACMANTVIAQDFTQITTGSLVNDGGWSTGCAWGDIDADGDNDLFVVNNQANSSVPQSNMLYLNNGDGTFIKSTNLIIAESGNSVSAVMVDYDNDEDLDIFVVNDKGKSNFLFRNDGSLNFTKITNLPFTTEINSFLFAVWIDVNIDGYLDVYISNRADTNQRLYINNKNGGYIKTVVAPDDNQNGRTPSWIDYDNDGDLDLFSVSYEGNYMYRNDLDCQGVLKFTKVNLGNLTADNFNTTGGSWGDYDGDGDLDVLCTNTLADQTYLYKNNGNSIFARVNTTFKSASSGGFIDYDNDGDLDIFTGQNEGGHNYLYVNDGNGNYTINTNSILYTPTGMLTYGVAWADVNKDGLQDVYICQRNDLNNLFFLNKSNLTNKWLSVKLRGKASGKQAFGSKVRIKANGKWQLAYVMNTGNGGGGINSEELEFGLGSATKVDSLQICWYGTRITQTFTNIAVNQYLVYNEPDEQQPLSVHFAADTAYLSCSQQSLVIQAFVSGYYNTLTVNGITQSATSFTVSATGRYIINASTACQTASDTIWVLNATVNPLTIPNAVTPNEDKIGDAFVLPTELICAKLDVYNRWGELVYQSNCYQNNWVPDVPTGDYYYFISSPCLTEPVKGFLHVMK